MEQKTRELAESEKTLEAIRAAGFAPSLVPDMMDVFSHINGLTDNAA